MMTHDIQAIGGKITITQLFYSVENSATMCYVEIFHFLIPTNFKHITAIWSKLKLLFSLSVLGMSGNLYSFSVYITTN